ncbi:MAG: biotin--[acetyl-CoA-carboxylase] ligase [Salinivirgaceae bacterium]|nr:biotin--[acetyl-CoA-carboxylase] ligase [Salinivirgaceae bacterium]
MNKTTLIELKQADSTNAYLKNLLSSEILPEGIVVLAKDQTNGKGQGANSWESEAKKNLTFSLLLKPEFLPADKMFLISKVVSLGIVDYLNSLNKKFTIKWPNDIYYLDKKIAGILIENQLLGNKLNYSIIGIGLNVNQELFYSDAPNPMSLKNIFHKEFNLPEMLANIISQINIWYEILQDGWFDKINDSYFNDLYRNTGFYDFTAENETFHAKIKSIEEDGQMVLKTTKGELRKFYFKEVEFVI